VTPKRQAKEKQKNKTHPEEAHWQTFEQNGSIGAFLMFHRVQAQARVDRKSAGKSSAK
jgi:hypothetical protein